MSVVPSHNVMEIAAENFSKQADEAVDFPENMILLDEKEAYIPELTHFESTWFVDPNRIYTEYELQLLEEQQTQKEYLNISSTNSSEEIRSRRTRMNMML